MLRQVSVIVPVFNGLSAFKKLIESLAQTYPTSTRGLEFLFLDDGSTDPALHEFYLGPFFNRTDVKLKKRATNLGFIKTVNEAVQSAVPDSDLVLLNSDTQIWSRSFEKLQELALRHPKAASITPFTNSGTIASLFRWPYGLDSDPLFSPAEIAECVSRTAPMTPYVSAPTGVGFCMYIPRVVWRIVGELSEVFGKGYGEECDWCQRAVKAGFDHLICTETYVHHSGTASFSSEEKRRLIEQNSRLLEKRNPGYNAAVVRYVDQRPLKAECVSILGALASWSSKNRDSGAKTILFILHQDPFDPECGGTEKYTKSLMDSLSSSHQGEGNLALQGGVGPLRTERRGANPVSTIQHPGLQSGVNFVLCIFKKGFRNFEVRALYKDTLLIEESFHQDSLPHILSGLATWTDVLHINHLSGWPAHLVDHLVNLPFSYKMMTVHDYFLLCPSTHLLKKGNQFCGVEADLKACNQCLSQCHGYWNTRIEQYRAVSQSIFEKMDRVIVPSHAVAHYLERGLGDGYRSVKEKVQIVGHDISYIPASGRPNSTKEHQRKNEKWRIAFIGHLAPHKGSEVIADALEGLSSRGFTPEIWGTYHGSRQKTIRSKVPHFSFQTVSDLKTLFAERQPDLVALPSLCAETFSYILYESLILGRVPLVVGPFGNPADLVSKEQLGSVMASAEGKCLVHSCLEVVKNYSVYLENVARFANKAQTETSSHLPSYLSSLKSREKSSIQELIPFQLPGLSQFDFVSKEKDGVIAKIAFEVQFKIRQHRRLERWVVQSAKKCWIALQKIRHYLKRVAFVSKGTIVR